MSYEYIRSRLETYFIGNWQLTLVAVDNDKFIPEPESSWVRIGVRPYLAENAALGTDCVRYNALFYIQVFVPINSGPGPAFQLVDEASTLMANKIIDNVHTYQADASYIGDDGQGWFQINVNVPCWYQN
jgi:hypothetical protein